MSTANKTLTRVAQGHTYAGITDLKIMCCPMCGVTYGIPTAMQEAAHAAGNRQITWFCPNGHNLGYNAESDEEKARKKAESDADWYRKRHQAERDLREHTEHKLRAQKGATTKAKKRHAAALCPCCNRSFVQLRRHLASQHPDYDPAKAE